MFEFLPFKVELKKYTAFQQNSIVNAGQYKKSCDIPSSKK